MQNGRLWVWGLLNPRVCFSILFLEWFEFKMLYQKEFISKMSNYFRSADSKMLGFFFKKKTKTTKQTPLVVWRCWDSQLFGVSKTPYPVFYLCISIAGSTTAP